MKAEGTSSPDRIADSEAIAAHVETLANALAVAMKDVPRWALVGIRRGGAPLAERLSVALRRRGLRPERGAVDITFYRDDLYTGVERGDLGETTLDFSINGCGIVLVDDVLFTGRTVRAALGEVWDYGRPAFIRLLALVDRGHRELPIQADFVALTLPTARGDKVVVRWAGHEGATTDELLVERSS